MSEIDQKLKRVNSLFERVSNTPKPKSESASGTTGTGDKKKKKKLPKNIKIDNMQFDGNSDINWDDFITMNAGEGTEDEDEQPTTNTNNQDETTQ